MLSRGLLGHLADTDATVSVAGRERDWTCIECGHEVTTAVRPTVCPVCNCRTSDLPDRFHLFFRAESMDAEPGLVTGFRQFGSGGST